MLSRVARFCLPDSQFLDLPRHRGRVAARRCSYAGRFWQASTTFRFVSGSLFRPTSSYQPHFSPLLPLYAPNPLRKPPQSSNEEYADRRPVQRAAKRES